MPSQRKQNTSHSMTSNSWALLSFLAMMLPCSSNALGAAIYSVHVDREAQNIVLKGDGFIASTTLSLGGITVATANVTATELDIPFANEVYSAVQWEGSYNLIVDGTDRISVYIDAPILAPPPPGGPDCPCIAGWEAAGLITDTFMCTDLTDGSQSIVYGNSFDGFNRFIAAAFDPNNIYFDEANPGNSVSFCALAQSGVYSVTEPVVNQEQYLDCYDWIRVRSAICLF